MSSHQHNHSHSHGAASSSSSHQHSHNDHGEEEEQCNHEEHSHHHDHGHSHSVEKHFHDDNHNNNGNVEIDEEESLKSSIWKILGFGDDEEDEENVQQVQEEEQEEEEEEEDENNNNSAIKVLGKHLAKVKLEFEEKEFALRTKIAKLEKEKQHQQEMLKEALESRNHFREEVTKLEVQNTRKWQIEARDNWIAQVEALKEERARLKRQNEQLILELKKIGGEESFLTATTISSNNSNNNKEDNDVRLSLAKALSNLADESKRHSEKEAELLKQIEDLKQKEKLKDAECKALRKKLDFELELKWDRMHEEEEKQQSDGKKNGAWEAIVNIVAPRITNSFDDDEQNRLLIQNFTDGDSNNNNS